MRFWDSSGIVSLVLADAQSTRARVLIREDADMLAWWGTEIEAMSAVHRASRSGRLPASAVADAVARISSIAGGWREVQPGPEVRREAKRVLGVHSLRTGDALQLAAALVAADGSPAALDVVCFDERLTAALRAEGFIVHE